MSDTDQAHEAVERLAQSEHSEALRPGFDRRAFLRRTALTGVAVGSVEHAAGRLRVERARAVAAVVPPMCSDRTRTTNSCSSTT